MKIIIECEKCGNKVELNQETQGNHSYIYDKMKRNEFTVFEYEIDTDISSSFYEYFPQKLLDAKTKEEIEEIFNDEINSNVDIDKKLKEIRFDCRKCGDYIVLTDIDQF